MAFINAVAAEVRRGMFCTHTALQQSSGEIQKRTRKSLYLDPDFWQVDLHGELLPAVDIRVVGLLEGSLQLMQLVGGEGRPIPPMLLLYIYHNEGPGIDSCQI